MSAVGLYIYIKIASNLTCTAKNATFKSILHNENNLYEVMLS